MKRAKRTKNKTGQGVAVKRRTETLVVSAVVRRERSTVRRPAELGSASVQAEIVGRAVGNLETWLLTYDRPCYPTLGDLSTAIKGELAKIKSG